MGKFDFRIFKIISLIAVALADGNISKEEAKGIIIMLIEIFYPSSD